MVRNPSSISWHILPVIVIAQFCCTSLWFAGNAAIVDLSDLYLLPESALSYIISAVQLGFILGTLVFALLSIADRYSPSKVFFICAVLGALSNAVILWDVHGYYSILLVRFMTGFFLAGIYPVGMKIAADHFDKKLGTSLGWLVGALVLGTALPHLINFLSVDFSWRYIFLSTSALAVLGGLMIYIWVPDGPYRKGLSIFKISALKHMLANAEARSAAIGYFGHMWELYAFWAFTPILLSQIDLAWSKDSAVVSLLCFVVIAIGSISCIVAGHLSLKYGCATVAKWSVSISGACCVLVPGCLYFNLPVVALFLLFAWGASVIADSPLFSTLVAQNCTEQLKGSTLTMVNCIGFAITIISIQLTSYLWEATSSAFIFIVLALGPLISLGVMSFQSYTRHKH